MALGFLELLYKSNVLPYNDETTPRKLTGTKMLPIMEIDGKAMNESLDIIAAIDKKNIFQIREIQNSSQYRSFEELLTKLGTNVHNLAMPYWIWTPEFNDASRAYFQTKKEQKRGPFKQLVKNQNQFSQELLLELNIVANDLKPFYKSETMTIYDIMLASHIWGLYVVPEYQFPVAIHQYLQQIKAICHFDYHQDFWGKM
jgi:glutaredoxin 2